MTFLQSPEAGLGLGLIIGCLLTLSVFVSMRRENESWKRQAVAAADEALTAFGHAAAAHADNIALAADLDDALGQLADAKFTDTTDRDALLVSLDATAHRRLSVVGDVVRLPEQRKGDAS